MRDNRDFFFEDRKIEEILEFEFEFEFGFDVLDVRERGRGLELEGEGWEDGTGDFGMKLGQGEGRGVWRGGVDRKGKKREENCVFGGVFFMGFLWIFWW